MKEKLCIKQHSLILRIASIVCSDMVSSIQPRNQVLNLYCIIFFDYRLYSDPTTYFFVSIDTRHCFLTRVLAMPGVQKKDGSFSTIYRSACRFTFAAKEHHEKLQLKKNSAISCDCCLGSLTECAWFWSSNIPLFSQTVDENGLQQQSRQLRHTDILIGWKVLTIDLQQSFRCGSFSTFQKRKLY